MATASTPPRTGPHTVPIASHTRMHIRPAAGACATPAATPAPTRRRPQPVTRSLGLEAAQSGRSLLHVAAAAAAAAAWGRPERLSVLPARFTDVTARLYCDVITTVRSAPKVAEAFPAWRLGCTPSGAGGMAQPAFTR